MKKKAEWILWTVHNKDEKGVFQSYDVIRCQACLAAALCIPNSRTYILSKYCPNCGKEMTNGKEMKNFDHWV